MIILGPVAIAKNWVIGKTNDLPWYIPEDLKRFKHVTMGHTVVMGRKTYESILKRLNKPLSGRTNVVITRQVDYPVAEGVLKFSSLPEALKNLSGNVFLIGGAEIFREGLPLADKVYVTEVHKEYDGDVLFPETDWSTWNEVSREDYPEFSFVEYERK